MIGGTWHPDNKSFSGKTVAELLGQQPSTSSTCSTCSTWLSSSPGSLVCRILELDGCKTGAFFFGMSEDNLAKIYSRPWIVPGSDASLRAPWGPLGADHPHPRLRELGFSCEETVARMTSVPARRFGLRGRGVIEKGAFADIAVWKEDEFRSSATYDAPHQFASGVKCVMVNGTVPYLDGRFTGNRGGRFLERN